jgi:hypothetical protein
MLRERSFEATGQRGYTIKGVHNFRYAATESPGPGTYAPKFDAVMPTAPKYGFHNRPVVKGPPATAGYRNLASTLGAGPKWTMKARADDNITVI